MSNPTAAAAELDRSVQPARRRPQEHQLRGRQHLGQGHRDRPGHRRARRAALGQGLRRRPRHPHRDRPGRAAPRPDARARRRLPRRRARGRDGRGVRLLPARQGRRGAVDRHRDARPRRRRARRPPAPRLRHRDRDRRRRRGADQGDLRRQGRVGAVAPAGFQLGLDIAAIKARATRRRSAASSAATASPPGATPARSREQNSLWIIDTAAAYIAEHSKAEPFGPAARRVRRAARGRAPRQGRRAGADHPRHRLAGPADGRPLHRLDGGARLPRRRRAPAAGRARDVVPRPLPAHQGEAAGPRPAGRPRRSRSRSPGCRSSRSPTARTTRATTTATPTPDSPAIRGADPLIVLVPGVGMFSYGKDKQTARVAGEFYVNAINVMRGAEGLSTYAPIDEAEKFRIEYWALEEAKLQRMPKPKPLATRIALVTGAASRHRQGDRGEARGRGCLRRHRRPVRWRRRRRQRPGSASPTSRSACRSTSPTRRPCRRWSTRRCSPSAASTSSSTTPGSRCRSRCWRPPSRTGTSSTT